MSKHPVMAYVKNAIKHSNFRSVQHLCDSSDLNYKSLGHYLRSEYKFNLHYFIALVELLELDVFEFYSVVYKNEKAKRLL